MEKTENEAMSAPSVDPMIKFSAQSHGDRMLGGPGGGSSDVPGLVSLGFFLVILGAIFLITPDAVGAASAFIKDFTLVEIPGTPRWLLPAPASSHPVIYGAVERFCLAFGASQAVVLILRFVFRSSVSKKAKSLGDIVFWSGISYIAGLLQTGGLGWFTFWSGFIIFAGLSLIIRSLIILALGEKVV